MRSDVRLHELAWSIPDALGRPVVASLGAASRDEGLVEIILLDMANALSFEVKMLLEDPWVGP